jgi:hypothetical protein
MGATGSDTALHACRGHGRLLQDQKRFPRRQADPPRQGCFAAAPTRPTQDVSTGSGFIAAPGLV